MAASNFDACLDIVLRYEGGFSLLRSDPGNWTGGKVGRGVLKGTKFGIAASAHPTLDIAHLSKEQAGRLYRSAYWDVIGGDALSDGLDLAVFDSAVNSGPSRATGWLRHARVGSANDGATIDAICAARLSFLHALGTWRAFGKGWGTRVAGIEAAAHRMALGSSATASAAMTVKAKVAKRNTTTAKVKAKTTGAIGALGAGQTASSGGHPTIVIVFLLAALIAAGIFAFAAWRQSQRAEALFSEAAAS